MEVFSDTICTLGEGPLWHPERKQLIWFDILGMRLYVKGETGKIGGWQFDEYVSAAGWVDQETLLMASATGLWRVNIETGARKRVARLEADDPT
ncbi:MAG: SMP-30/gluconolactonase/LRE family protein, partial [Pseudomonadota bacterium]